jgi:hypothetical protein
VRAPAPNRFPDQSSVTGKGRVDIRRYRGKLLTKPNKAALRRIRERLATEVLALRGANAEAVIAKLNPIIKGWAAYYRIGVSKRAFNSLDAYVWRLVYKLAWTPIVRHRMVPGRACPCFVPAEQTANCKQPPLVGSEAGCADCAKRHQLGTVRVCHH